MTLQAILECAQASFEHNNENRDVWMTVRYHCKVLLGAEDLSQYQKLFDSITTTKIVRRTGRTFSRNFIPRTKTLSQATMSDDVENKSKDMREKVIAYDQLKAFSLYLKDKPAELAAYCKVLVSIYCFVHACIFFVTIISHHHSVGSLQL